MSTMEDMKQDNEFRKVEEDSSIWCLWNVDFIGWMGGVSFAIGRTESDELHKH